ncbi:molybdopterin-dependent oxidoreductase [Caloranaerobacter sp. DY30410]|uniref:molybdopterin-dependent oxidoreductase n=1 Tax=Caloranaerobacter sp. DY30410 TaxID=3238305 RepID=UPI003D086804
MKTISHGCTLDCWDCCKFNVIVDDNRVIKIEGDREHPYTKGIICKKGRKHLERLYHKERIYTPLLRKGNKWIEIDYNEALEILSERLRFYIEKYGSNCILHYFESGSGGVLKSIENIFFNFLGGITLPSGSTCWGAGIQAQIFDFGDVKGHSLKDMFNAKNIVLWGRNPANTSIHLFHTLKEAKKKGIKIIVIDPIYTDTAKISDMFIRINPSTDGALAIAVTKIAIDKGYIDLNFIKKYVKGFDEYKNYIEKLSLDFLIKECGVKEEIIEKLAYIYGVEKPTTTYPGYGLQKYHNGGNTIRAIDALAAITGNIGKKGSGVNYANRIYPDVLNLDPFDSMKFSNKTRYVEISKLYDFILNENNPPIKVLFVSKANPLAQLPNLNKAKLAFSKIDFKICIDMFMTDTARNCDLFLPCTNTLESEDIVFSSMNNPYIIYNEKAVEPKNKLMDEYYFFKELARKMGIKKYPNVSKHEYIQKIVEPLLKMNITLEDIKKGYVTIQNNDIAWHDLIFKTPSGKIEIYSEKASECGLSPFPIYQNRNSKTNKIRLITSHAKDSIFSQHFIDVKGISKAFINHNTARKHNIKNGEKIILKSKNGEINVEVVINENIPDNVVHMYTGWWEKHGNPNFLTDNIDSDMGGQIAYYDTFVEIVKK